jgi:hypothetical protein
MYSLYSNIVWYEVSISISFGFLTTSSLFTNQQSNIIGIISFNKYLYLSAVDILIILENPKNSIFIGPAQ